MLGKVLIIANVARHIASFHMPHIESLLKQGYEVHVACNCDQDRERLQVLPIQVHHIPVSRSPLASVNLKATLQLYQLMKRNAFDVVHCHTPIAGAMGRLAAWLNRCRCIIYSVHGFHFHGTAPARDWLFYYPVEWLASLITDVIIATNDEDYVRAMRFPRWGGLRVFHVNGVGLDLEQFAVHSDSVRLDLGISENAPVVACIAEFAPAKNHEFLIRGWHRVIQQFPDARLLLIGEGRLESRIKDLVAELELSASVVFTGYRRDVPDLINLADVVVLVSKREGLPRSIMEAMAAGRPVIGTNIRGIRDLVIPGSTGVLVQQDNVNELVDSLCELIQNQGLARAMGMHAREYIIPYRMENVLAQLDEIYTQYSEGKS